MVHFAPTVSAPFATSHVDNKVTLVLIIMETSVILSRAVATRGRGEAVDFSLRQKASVLSHPSMILVKGLQSVLLLVLPSHVLLLVGHWIPPDIQEAFGPGAATHEERSQVEARAVLRQKQVHRVDVAVPHWARCEFVKVRVGERMGDIKRVVFVDIAVHMVLEIIEQVIL